MKNLPLEEKFITENPLDRWNAHRILLGVSGGADSTALVALFHHFRERFGLKIYVAHANHQLRGAESDGDVEFTATLCEKLEIPFITRALDISRTADGLESDARRARYEFLSETALELGCRYLALAHHRDDQAETIFHRILRGTGIAGLAGMARKRTLNSVMNFQNPREKTRNRGYSSGNQGENPSEFSAVTLIRPLLSFSRAEILEYLTEKKLTWRTDSSNFCTEMTRNRIRQEVLPQLRSAFNPQLDTALVRLGTLAEATQKFLDSQTEFLLKRIV
ncbi:MAG: tRNA lysidine(34) synthetase TilS [Planctomycetia bacterium]|nr:tRNA lysidine(34) synthetase TilS [Planctomycetia bacterium]